MYKCVNNEENLPDTKILAVVWGCRGVIHQERGAEWSRKIWLTQSQRGREQKRRRMTEGRVVKDPPLVVLMTRKRNGVIREGGTGDRERVSVSDWDFFDKLLKSRKTPSLYSSAKNTTGDVRVNPLHGAGLESVT